MDRYKVLRQLGDGTYGSVWKAVHRQTGEVVAVKRMKRKFLSWEECLALREVKALRKLSHPCIVKLQEVIRENNELFLIFEYMDYNLYQVIKQRQGIPFPEEQIRDWAFQILQGLNYMHNSGIFHRDLKPENLLVHENRVVKIADFGLARESMSEPPYTEYVSTRWYRAPEVLFRKADYTAAVDLFALGAIMAELFSLKPLFPGSTELDEIMKIRTVMGSFTEESWPEGIVLLKQLGITLEQTPPPDLQSIIPGAPPVAIDLIHSLCQWDPAKRPSTASALAHPFFKDAASLPRPITPVVLQERSNILPRIHPPVQAAEKPRLGRRDSKRRAGRAPPSESKIKDLPLRNGPMLSKVLSKDKAQIDYAPMQSSINSMKVRERQRLARSQKPRQAIDRVRGGQPPDLWINAQGVAQARQAAGFSQVTRGAPIQSGTWLSKGTCSAFGGTHGSIGHRKAVPVREAGYRSSMQGATKEGPLGGKTWLAGQPVNAKSCQLSCIIGSTALEAKYTPLSASVRRAAAAAAALGKVV